MLQLLGRHIARAACAAPTSQISVPRDVGLASRGLTKAFLDPCRAFRAHAAAITQTLELRHASHAAAGPKQSGLVPPCASWAVALRCSSRPNLKPYIPTGHFHKPSPRPHPPPTPRSSRPRPRSPSSAILDITLMGIKNALHVGLEQCLLAETPELVQNARLENTQERLQQYARRAPKESTQPWKAPPSANAAAGARSRLAGRRCARRARPGRRRAHALKSARSARPGTTRRRMQPTTATHAGQAHIQR